MVLLRLEESRPREEAFISCNPIPLQPVRKPSIPQNKMPNIISSSSDISQLAPSLAKKSITALPKPDQTEQPPASTQPIKTAKTGFIERIKELCKDNPVNTTLFSLMVTFFGLGSIPQPFFWIFWIAAFCIGVWLLGGAVESCATAR